MSTELVRTVNVQRFLLENDNSDDYDRAELIATIPYKDGGGLLEIVCELDLPTLERACLDLEEVVDEKLHYIRGRILDKKIGYVEGDNLSFQVMINLLADVVDGEIIE